MYRLMGGGWPRPITSLRLRGDFFGAVLRARLAGAGAAAAGASVSSRGLLLRAQTMLSHRAVCFSSSLKTAPLWPIQVLLRAWWYRTTPRFLFFLSYLFFLGRMVRYFFSSAHRRAATLRPPPRQCRMGPRYPAALSLAIPYHMNQLPSTAAVPASAWARSARGMHPAHQRQ